MSDESVRPEPPPTPQPAPIVAPLSDPAPAAEMVFGVEAASAANISGGPADAMAAPPLLPPSPPAPAEPVAHPIRFHGRTDEYFRIWIVNTLLTLLTLGVFFSWAKVRKRRYLRGSTELLGHRFDYRANPVRLLIGHVAVLILFLGYSLFGVVYPAIRFGVIALAIVLLPWIVVRSFTFNAHNTVYRGLRFRFNPSLSAALKVYLLEPLLIGVTLGLYYPAWQRAKRDYAVSNHRLGDAYFRFEAATGHFYTTYLAAGAVMFGALLTGGTIIALTITRQPGVQPTLVQLIPFFILYAFGFFISRHLIYAMLFNHVWNHTRVDEHRFRATLDTGRWVGLQLVNLGAIIVSAGLLYPWALIRAQRYAAASLQFVPHGSVDTIQRVASAAGSATGDMAAEFIGLDFGL